MTLPFGRVRRLVCTAVKVTMTAISACRAWIRDGRSLPANEERDEFDEQYGALAPIPDGEWSSAGHDGIPMGPSGPRGDCV